MGEHGAAGTAAHFFRELTVGGVARPVDTLLMASLLLYCSQPFGQVASSSTRQLAFVFRVRCCVRHTRVQSGLSLLANASKMSLHACGVPCRPFSCMSRKHSSPPQCYAYRAGQAWPGDATVGQPVKRIVIASQGCLQVHDRACSAQGINRLGLVFQQLVIASLAVSTVTTLEAAAKWPDLVWLASALFFGVAGARDPPPANVGEGNVAITSSFAPKARAYIHPLCLMIHSSAGHRVVHPGGSVQQLSPKFRHM